MNALHALHSLLPGVAAVLAATRACAIDPAVPPPPAVPVPTLRLAPSMATNGSPSAITSGIPAGASRPFIPPAVRLNNPNREALDGPGLVRPGSRPRDDASAPATAPPALLRPSRAELSWRSVADALNPLAPIPPELRRVRYVHEMTRPVDHAYPRSLRDPLTPGIPRAFQDPITHEASLRLW